MALIVQKFGGTSVGNMDRIKNVAKRVARTFCEGNEVVVVLSAMSGETNRLVGLCHEASEFPIGREYDLVISTGEQVTIGLLAIVLKEMGYNAKSLLGHQVPIVTDSQFASARIESIDGQKMKEELSKGTILVVAGLPGR